MKNSKLAVTDNSIALSLTPSCRVFVLIAASHWMRAVHHACTTGAIRQRTVSYVSTEGSS